MGLRLDADIIAETIADRQGTFVILTDISPSAEPRVLRLVGDPQGLALVSGETYLVFGDADGFGTGFDLTTLDGTNAFRIQGAAAGDRSALFALTV